MSLRLCSRTFEKRKAGSILADDYWQGRAVPSGTTVKHIAPTVDAFLGPTFVVVGCDKDAHAVAGNGAPTVRSHSSLAQLLGK
jgi:hypothetical protein